MKGKENLKMFALDLVEMLFSSLWKSILGNYEL